MIKIVNMNIYCAVVCLCDTVVEFYFTVFCFQAKKVQTAYKTWREHYRKQRCKCDK